MALVANVMLWGERIGAVHWDQDHRVANFAYDPDFIKKGIEVSPIKMPLSRDTYRFPELRDSNSFRGLPGMLADSLPERFGNQLLSVWLSTLGKNFEDINPVERLCYVGTRGMGALEFEPDVDFIKPGLQRIELDGLLAVAREVMEDRNEMFEGDPDLESLIQIGTSAGGAKAKALIAVNDKTGEIVSGQENAPPGFTHYLIKFSGVENSEHESSIHVGRVEMAYHLMAVLAGIDMMPCQLIETKDRGAHFMTERFDRNAMGTKYHIQTFCGIAHEDRDPVGMSSYERLFAVARQIGLTQKSVTQIFKRMVFNIITRNQDDHTKNHAFMMDSTGAWQLTPAYDLCFSYKKNSVWIDQHQLNCNGKRDHFTLADIAAAAAAADVKNYRRIIDEVNQAVSEWPNIANSVGLPKQNADTIGKLFRNF